MQEVIAKLIEARLVALAILVFIGLAVWYGLWPFCKKWLEDQRALIRQQAEDAQTLLREQLAYSQQMHREDLAVFKTELAKRDEVNLGLMKELAKTGRILDRMSLTLGELVTKAKANNTPK